MTAISVSTYGSAWKSTAPDGENTGSRCASAEPNPNSSVAASARPGFQRPKISAASAMNPRPAVMFCEKECTKPIERNAPPIAARPPDVITAR